MPRFPANGFPQASTTFPVRSVSGRMISGPLEINYHDGETIVTLITDDYGNVTRCELLEVKYILY